MRPFFFLSPVLFSVPNFHSLNKYSLRYRGKDHLKAIQHSQITPINRYSLYHHREFSITFGNPYQVRSSHALISKSLSNYLGSVKFKSATLGSFVHRISRNRHDDSKTFKVFNEVDSAREFKSSKAYLASVKAGLEDQVGTKATS
ncbi:uncharacterized protein LOC110229759 isoform X2 [Arabidopsis lyrata subsp. lyrata]|uniref:uncharacterized protein LOC110229759 isoform X2 n=1 Tax=Arabidopsis lyrata subsp. lyrata TaxID=81972 RepID=UPI000A29D469|nr:uncharacterized protein LOC110229759 isoform X2 [Arabidopsis lyrata subsp. lyrata]|eukprot:XP_020886231.1 uncharacterized protein LOC110229759 isoform X2 [Arabidopsis lyrata subsp. lyrata]